jgi:hypothetical protein
MGFRPPDSGSSFHSVPSFPLTRTTCLVAHVAPRDLKVEVGKALVVEAGTKLLFAKDAALNIQGTLRINGSKDAQVELAGKATGAGFWQGVRINRSNSTRIDYARISGAKNGIYMHASKPSIENTILANNVVGLFVGEYGSASEPIVKNSLITQNHEDGVVLRASSAVFEQSRETGDGEFVANTTPLLLFLSA